MNKTGVDLKIHSFEGLRGVLSVLVCVGHIGLNTVAERFGLHVRFELAVPVFFALSGFVLSRAYYFRKRSFQELVVGRIARLYPLHVLTLFWCALLTPFGTQDWIVFLQNVIVAHNIGFAPNVLAYNFPSWSISVEMYVSLFFYFLLLKRESRKVLWLLSAGIGISVLVAIVNRPAIENTIFGCLNVGVLSGFAGFSTGAAAFLMTLYPSIILSHCRRWIYLLLAILFSMLLLPSWSWAAGGLFCLCTFLVIATLGMADNCRLLSSRPLVFVGSISYSIYLLHIPVLYFAAKVFGDASIRGYFPKTLILVSIVVLSVLTHRFYEVPARRVVLEVLGKVGRLFVLFKR